MTKDEHNKILNDMKNSTSDADRMTLIMQLSTDYSGVLSERDTAKTTADTATAEANKFAKLNNELWLENSSQRNIGQETEVETATAKDTTPPAKLSFEALDFN